ncbi:ROK family transcriptional regulator [Paenibacillus elgii]|uniref:ROK family transcriptional regulator n=1 Tax=Paenibacillus elgii TaxID=189691 RepID=UPI002D7A7026|nr:ROK family transcriptional regulator [Paenibacillus elgii]
MENRTGNLQLIKKINSSLILNLLHRERILSRAEIADRLKLSRATVSSLVEELISEGYIDEIGERSSAGAGRKAVALEISRDKGFVIAISLQNESLRCALFNFHNEIMFEFKQFVVYGNDEIYSFIKRAVDKILSLNIVKDGSLVKGIGIASPGIVDENDGVIVKSTLLKIHQLEIKKVLTQTYNLPVVIINDTKAAAFAEHYCGAAKGIENLLLFSVDEGIGAGLMINGEVYSGYKGAAGEIGHIQVDRNGLLCHCGRKGCIETKLNKRYILINGQNMAKSEQGAKIPETFSDILRAYEQSETWAVKLMKETCLHLLQALAAAINFISPEVVILYGWFYESEKLMKELKNELAQFPFPLPFDLARLKSPSFGEQVYLKGAATIMNNQFFKVYH